MSIHNESWSEDDIRELINEYKRRPILWNDTFEVKDKRKKVAEWKELANIFNTTVADIQRRTNNLKSTFFDEEKKMKKMKTARRKSYSPWVHYDDLKFLVETRDRDGTSSESEVVSGKEDHVEHIVPVEIESSDPPLSLTSRLANTRMTTLLSERASKMQPTEEERTTVTRRRTILSETTSRTPPPEENSTLTGRKILTASRILPSAEKEDAFSRSRTLLSERASRFFPAEGKINFSSSVSPNRGESAQTSPSKTSPFSTSSSKIAYYPQLGGLGNYSPTKRSSLYPDLGSPTQYTRSEQHVETSSQYSPTKLVTDTASRISPETERITKRRRLSNSEDSPPSPTKVRRLVRDDDHADENGSIISHVLSDDYDLFGAFIASEIRNLKHESSKMKLKGMIQRSIIQVMEEDSRMSGR
ncbi:uncharacterized protein [Anabrus simplex]|uniref:uncharacterized protein n=1 Tax=Anabrus simplex TaxID=316456 RepID=UPI0035A3C552